jgi:hypothetical protein
VLPITHAEPTVKGAALEIPPDVCRNAGIDAERSWVVLTEFNEFDWPGYDLAPVPGREPREFVYGFVTSGFMQTIRSQWAALRKGGRSVSVRRDD